MIGKERAGAPPGGAGIARRKTRKVLYGNVGVGGDAPISVQSMCTFQASDHDNVMGEIGRLAASGCEIVRVAVRERSDASCIGRIIVESPIPVVADVHFDHRLAVAAAKSGAAGLRINPGNIGGSGRVREVIDAAASAGIPVRVGVNSGSLEKDLKDLYSRDPAGALCESAARHAAMIERMGFADLVFSLKSSDPLVTVEANRMFAAGCDYPLHIGVTEAGPFLTGTARSAVALALLLSEGIGDTIRVSLSGDPVREVLVAWAVLCALGLRRDRPVVISCPTCGRCRLDVAGIAEELERVLPGKARGRDLKVAVMGCEVNGPGEAREADIGIAGSKGGAVLFRGGGIIKKLEDSFLPNLLAEIDRMLEEGGRGEKDSS